MVSASEALDRLRKGNQRFVSGQETRIRHVRNTDRPDPDVGQAPFAIILGCSDSRVPAEIVFDQAFGALFVIRVAGNVAHPSQLGSIEFAASKLGTQLVVVMGHSNCGAIEATLADVRSGEVTLSPNLQSIVDPIRPSIEKLLASNLQDDEALLDAAVRANVAATIDVIRRNSDTVAELLGSGKLMIAGAEYMLDSGVVEFFDLD